MGEDKLVVKMIKLIKKNELIWHLTDPRNKMVKRKAKAWKYIANECGLAVAEAKKKWKALRDSYFRRISRRKVLKKSKIKPDENYKYNTHMSFLKGYKSDKSLSLEYTKVLGDFASLIPLGYKGRIKRQSSTSDFIPSSDVSSTFISAFTSKKHKNSATKSRGCTEKFPQYNLSHARQTRTATAKDSFSNPHQTRAATSAAQDSFNKLEQTKPATPATSVFSSLNREDQLFCRSLVVKIIKFPLKKKNEAKIKMMEYLCLIEEDT